MSTFQSNHQNIENAVQAKVGDIEYRKKNGSNQDILQAWGEFLVRTGRANLTLEHHTQFHKAIRKAMSAGISEENVDLAIQRGKEIYLRGKDIKTREELSWLD